MRNAPKVYLVQELHDDNKMDVTSALGYGTMDYLLPRRGPAASVRPDLALEAIRAKVHEMRDGDFILDVPGTDPIGTLLLGIVLGETGAVDRVRWLRWDRRTDENGNRTKSGYYTPVEVNLADGEEL